MPLPGIHGQPLVPWDEDTQPQAPDLGYCTHNSLLFPTWHRPYVNLFEAWFLWPAGGIDEVVSFSCVLATHL